MSPLIYCCFLSRKEGLITEKKYLKILQKGHFFLLLLKNYLCQFYYVQDGTINLRKERGKGKKEEKSKNQRTRTNHQKGGVLEDDTSTLLIGLGALGRRLLVPNPSKDFNINLVHILSRLGWSFHVGYTPLTCLSLTISGGDPATICQITLVAHQNERNLKKEEKKEKKKEKIRKEEKEKKGKKEERERRGGREETKRRRHKPGHHSQPW